MSGAFLAGVIAGYGVAVPVGGIAVLIAGLSARTSWRVGAAAGLGAATADGVYALVAVLGGAALAAVVAPIAVPLRWAAATILLALAGHTVWAALRKRRGAADERAAADERGPDDERAALTSRRGAADERETLTERRAEADERASRAATPVQAYAGVLGLTLLNPATVGYFAALVLGRGGSGGGVWFVVGACLASASWQLLIAASGALAGRLLTGERAQLISALVSSTVIAALAVVMVW
jgi:arginine exporter protein ArgO